MGRAIFDGDVIVVRDIPRPLPARGSPAYVTAVSPQMADLDHDGLAKLGELAVRTPAAPVGTVPFVALQLLANPVILTAGAVSDFAPFAVVRPRFVHAEFVHYCRLYEDQPLSLARSF